MIKIYSVFIPDKFDILTFFHLIDRSIINKIIEDTGINEIEIKDDLGMEFNTLLNYGRINNSSSWFNEILNIFRKLDILINADDDSWIIDDDKIKKYIIVFNTKNNIEKMKIIASGGWGVLQGGWGIESKI